MNRRLVSDQPTFVSGPGPKPQDLRVQAERALLGSVLSDPERQQHLLDLIEAGDMSRPWHGQVLRAIQRVRDRGGLPGALAVYTELRQDPDLPRIAADDAVPVSNLMAAVPRSGNAGAYAAMVAGSGIRERLGLAGARLVQVAESGDLDALREQAAQARDDIAACHARWEALPEPLRRELLGPLRAGDEDAAPRGLAAVRADIARLRQDLQASSNVDAQERIEAIARQLAAFLTASARYRQRHAAQHAQAAGAGDWADGEAEDAALRDLVAAPSRLAEVRGWLRPHHFSRPENRELYLLMNEMHLGGKPVDPLTVAWESARRGAGVDLAELWGGTGAFAVSRARHVHRLGVLAVGRKAGLEIQADAADPARSTNQLIRSAAERISALEQETQAEPEPAARPHAVVSMKRKAGVAAEVTAPGREAAQ